ncbi:MAG: ABC transporter ATP-binding protein [Natronospirillum sp.]|uniref:ABC transporter ATP-binding protein n=1 Tax=Natronospirillum sp. TaxID=2812955 RepID=UPI0025E88C52|nr:ABC transporter ATP-binding protein [Natronospirillum sp.]MCH8552547.1 ABC transporter ATP-binding protein [Natronospirillum sp.]
MSDSSTNQTPEVSIRQLRRTYGDAVALDSIDLDIQPGEVIAVLGASGCGKSTLLRLIGGLDQPTSGTIDIGGVRVNTPGFVMPAEKRPVNMVFQDYALWPHMTVNQIIRFGMRYRKIPKSDWAPRTKELLSLLELDGLGDRFPRQLSGGQQQRVAIARALATNPRLLLLDEPLSNLDSQLRLQMRDELAVILRQVGTTAMYVTHDLQEALTLGDRLIVMRHGKIEQMGTALDIFRRPATPWVAGLVGFSNRVQVEVERALDGRIQVRQGDRRLEISGDSNSVSSGDRMTMMMQPAALSLAEVDKCNSNCITAVVRDCHFEGLSWRLRCAAGDSLLTVHADRSVAPGEMVCIAVPPERARAYPSEAVAAA